LQQARSAEFGRQCGHPGDEDGEGDVASHGVDYTCGVVERYREYSSQEVAFKCCRKGVSEKAGIVPVRRETEAPNEV
jgi:hypothetical protein